jgi:hypothetical protein
MKANPSPHIWGHPATRQLFFVAGCPHQLVAWDHNRKKGKISMAEENKAQEQPAAVKVPDAPPQGQASIQGQAKKKNKKVLQMSLKEVEEKLNSIKEKMGRFDSRYARELLKQKEALANKK